MKYLKASMLGWLLAASAVATANEPVGKIVSIVLGANAQASVKVNGNAAYVGTPVMDGHTVVASAGAKVLILLIQEGRLIEVKATMKLGKAMKASTLDPITVHRYDPIAAQQTLDRLTERRRRVPRYTGDKNADKFKVVVTEDRRVQVSWTSSFKVEGKVLAFLESTEGGTLASSTLALSATTFESPRESVKERQSVTVLLSFFEGTSSRPADTVEIPLTILSRNELKKMREDMASARREQDPFKRFNLMYLVAFDLEPHQPFMALEVIREAELVLKRCPPASRARMSDHIAGLARALRDVLRYREGE